MVDEVYQTQSYPKALRALPVRWNGAKPRGAVRGAERCGAKMYVFVNKAAVYAKRASLSIIFLFK